MEGNRARSDAVVALALLVLGVWGAQVALQRALRGPHAPAAAAVARTPAPGDAPFAALARAVDAQPASADRYAALGAAYLAAGRPLEAQMPLRVALVLQPQHVTARADYARARAERARGPAQ